MVVIPKLLVSMRLVPSLMLAAAFGLATPALAREVSTGLEVQVYPYAASGNGQVLLYPGQPYGPIHLHMPSPRRPIARVRHHEAQVEAVTPPTPKPRHKAVKKLAATSPEPAPSQAPNPQADTNNPYFGNSNLGNVLGGAPAPAPQAPPRKKQASAAPAPASKPAASEPGLSKRSIILFAKNADEPAEGALKSIGFLASDLNAAMTGPNSRVELQAYGGNHGDKGSDARRLSLKRALAIRQILINDGVSADRIDVRAMGGADDTGPNDRVDVFVRA